MGILTATIAGALVGFGAINVMALIARNGSKHYDVSTFSSSGNVFEQVDAWAKDNGYRLVRTEGTTRVYQKGHNFLTSPMFLEVTQDGEQYTLKSYVQINGLLIKGDMALSVDSFVAKVPRSMAKKAQNTLFATLGQPALP